MSCTDKPVSEPSTTSSTDTNTTVEIALDDVPQPNKSSQDAARASSFWTPGRASGAAATKASLASGIFNLSNTILGAGMLGLPSAFADMGLVVGVIFLFLFGFFSGLGLQLLSECADRIGRPATFYSVAEGTVPKLGYVIDAAVAIKCFGVAASYLIVVADSMPKVIGEDHGIWSDRQLWAVIAGAIGAPLAFLKSMDALRHTSLLALVCIVFIVLLILLYSFGLEGELDPCPDSAEECKGDINLAPTGAIASLSSLSTFIFAYTCHQNIFPITNELERPTKARTSLLIIVSISSALAVYLIISCAGFMTYGDNVESDILNSYPSNTVVAVARVAISIVVITSYPLQSQPSIRSIRSLYGGFRHTFCGKPKTSDTDLAAPQYDTLHFVICSIFIALTILIAVLVEDLGKVLGVVGATGSTTISYILPGFCFYRLHRETPSFKSHLALAMFVMGCIIMPLTLAFVFIGS